LTAVQQRLRQVRRRQSALVAHACAPVHIT
jgi:hypothetical protein